MNFRENLKYLMDFKNIQTKELSKLSGISENTIKSYLKEASSEPKISNAISIAKALGVSVEYLANLDERESGIISPQILEIEDLLKKMSQKDLNILQSVTKSIAEKYSEEKGGQFI